MISPHAPCFRMPGQPTKCFQHDRPWTHSTGCESDPYHPDRQREEPEMPKTHPHTGFVGSPCTHETPATPWGSAYPCRDAAVYLVIDGDIPLPTCSRHLLDTVETLVRDDALTIASDPLGIIRLRTEEND